MSAYHEQSNTESLEQNLETKDLSNEIPNHTLFDSLAEQFGNAPWWVSSGVFHGLMILLVFLLGALFMEINNEPEVIKTVLQKNEIEEVEEIIEPTVLINQNKIDWVELEYTPVPSDDPEFEPMQTDQMTEEEQAQGEADEIGEISLGDTGNIKVLGPGPGGSRPFGRPGPGGPKLSRFGPGPTKATECAVKAALAWLARHQEQDGRWDSQKYGARTKTDTSCTAFSLLAFLGAGHTEKLGRYRDNVRKAVQWLITQQKANGVIWADGDQGSHGPGYAHAIAGMALAEAAGMGRVPATKAAAQKALNYSCDIQQQGEGSEKLGWRYKPQQAGDVSVTGWYVMQLKSAKVAGLQVDFASFDGATAFLDSVESRGSIDDDSSYGMALKYGYKKAGSATARRTAIGLLCRQFIGAPKEKLEGGVRWFMQNGGLPEWGGSGGNVDLYYWYYGTLCAFQQGGELWKQWNEAMKKAFVENQRKGGPKDGSLEDVDGSWDPVGRYSDRWGRVGQTAIAALCLEVYYRYLPMYR